MYTPAVNRSMLRKAIPMAANEWGTTHTVVPGPYEIGMQNVNSTTAAIALAAENTIRKIDPRAQP